MSLLGRTFYRLYHEPLGRLRATFSGGGPWEQRRTARGEQAMAAAARSLPPPMAISDEPITLHLLTGNRFWHQSAFCLWTFAQASGRRLTPMIYDDGTLGPEHREPLARMFPAATFLEASRLHDELHARLPLHQFPFLHDRWERYPNIRKLIAPHLGSRGWKLVVDSDLLFFRRPDFLLNWLNAPTQSLHATDHVTSYGYSRSLLDSLAEAPVADRVNVGLMGLRSEALDWERIEAWCRTLIQREGTHYYLEQALVALLVAGRDTAVAPEAEYVTLPVLPEANDCRAVMHHYVADSKRWYFQRNWQRVLALAEQSSASDARAK